MRVSLGSAPEPVPGEVLVAGGGVAGMQAALRLAALGKPVLLVERGAGLGGKVMRLDKVYPTDHCAFCPAWTMAAACYREPRIRVLLHTALSGLSSDGEQTLAELSVTPPSVDPELCLFCGACRDVCPEGALLERDPGLTWDPALPPAMRIDMSRCTGCGKCVEACPSGAVVLKRQGRTFTLPVDNVIYATGFDEPKPGEPAYAPEFGAFSHPDIFTAMEFEQWHAEHRTLAPLARRSDGKAVQRVAFVQCAGARDIRHLPYCAAVCCLHGMKQSRWLKRRQPDLDVTVFYTDLRAPGKAQESYMLAGAAEGVHLVRSRPGLILPGVGGVAVRYDDPDTGRGVGEWFDLVVVNGGLAQCPLPGAEARADGVGCTSCAASETSSGTASGPLACGFCADPTDIAGSVVQGADAAVRAVLRQGGAL